MSISRGWVRGSALTALWLSAATAPTAASAADFALTGIGTLQNLNHYLAGGNFCQFVSSGTIWSVNGAFSDSRGNLSWTGQGKLDVVARATLIGQGTTPSCYDVWRAVNAEDFPLEFTISNGDPAASLRITPRLVGSVTHMTGIGGNPGTSTMTIEVRMKVSVNGQVVTQDQLQIVSDQVAGQSASWNLQLPKGNLNTVVIPGAANGTQVAVSAFVFARGMATGSYSAIASSPYGNDVPLLVTVEVVGPVGVGDGEAAASLSLGVRPNPSRGRAFVSYALPESGPVEVALYDVRGARIAALVDRVEEAGRHEVRLDAPSASLRNLGTGIYLVELRAGAERRTAKLVVTD